MDARTERAADHKASYAESRIRPVRWPRSPAIFKRARQFEQSIWKCLQHRPKVFEIGNWPSSIGFSRRMSRETPDSLASSWLIRYVLLEKFGSRAGEAEGGLRQAQERHKSATVSKVLNSKVVERTTTPGVQDANTVLRA